MDTSRDRNIKYRKPVILIYAADINEELLKEVEAGIEEEGVPFQVKMYIEDKNAENLAYEAAKSSILEAGLGMRESKFCFQSLLGKSFSPLLNIDTEDKKALRIFGSNVARFVKGCSLRL